MKSIKLFFSMFLISFHKRPSFFGKRRNTLYEFGITFERPGGVVCDDDLDLGLLVINGKIFLIWWFINFCFPWTWPKDLNFKKRNA